MTILSECDFKEIIARRDRRYDGRFFFGVKTTKIYCRIGCPAKPKPENIVICRSASEAERLGYRACLRCKPDLAPGSKWLEGTGNTVSRALRLIESSESEDLNVETLARKLGVTDRHLRRLFEEHLGASPIEVIGTQRLHFAKMLIQSSQLPLTHVALTSGFRSVRRFNEAFKEKFWKSPSTFRACLQEPSDEGLNLAIPLREPYDWDTVLAFLNRHAAYGIEFVKDGIYTRFLPQAKGFGRLEVSKEAGTSSLRVQFFDVPISQTRQILWRLRNLFDTDHNPFELESVQGVDPRGIRVPGSFDPLEVGVSIVLSQLVSTENAKRKLKKLIETLGRRLGTWGGHEVFAFPEAEALASLDAREIGIPEARARAIRELARLVLERKICFECPIDFEEAYQSLLEIYGVGPWTASMILMRCYGNPDAFPTGDLIVRRAIDQKIVNPDDWPASKAYLTHCLWRDFSRQLSSSRGVKT